MSWRSITENDLTKKISALELDAFRDAALDDGDDPIAAQIESTTDMVRGYIVTSGVDLGPAGTLPERLIGPACDVIILDIMSRAGGIVIDDDSVRRTNAASARKLFERVADGKYAIDDPVTGTESTDADLPIYHATRTRRFDRRSQDGI
jgi:hypothetical protein